MKFISGFLIGILAGMFCILGPIVAFLGGIAVGWKVWGDDSDETPSKPTYPTYDSPGKPGTVNYQGMSTSAEKGAHCMKILYMLALILGLFGLAYFLEKYLTD